MRSLVLASLAFTIACAPATEEAFIEQYGEATCAKFEECFEDAFGLLYDSVDECADGGADDSDEAEPNDAVDQCRKDHCEYDSAQAKACLDEIKKADCPNSATDFADLYEACDTVTTCDSDYNQCVADALAE